MSKETTDAPKKPSKGLKVTTQIRKANNCIRSGGIELLEDYLEALGVDAQPGLKVHADKLKAKWREREPKARFWGWAVK